jgi:cytochrome c oxidase subunit 2
MPATSETEILRTEIRWAIAAGSAVLLILIAIIVAAIGLHISPPSNVERIDPKTLHLSGEFTEGNLGTRVGADGRITTRIVTAQFEFAPHCVEVPEGEAVTLRLASPDVIHGILVTGTNVNTMVVPGYVSEVHTVFTRTGDLLMPCDEYCGIGHSEMWATVRVVPASQFHPDAQGKVSCSER